MLTKLPALPKSRRQRPIATLEPKSCAAKLELLVPGMIVDPPPSSSPSSSV
jgi:hypothetical protein